MAQTKQTIDRLPLELRTLPTDKRRQIIADGWEGVTRAINTAGLASVERKGFQSASLLGDAELTFAYRQNWLAREAVQRPAVDITRAWWTVKSAASPEDAAEVDAWIRDMGFRQRFKWAITWARLYGGGAIVLGVDDGQAPEIPLNYKRIRRINFARVVDRRYCNVLMRDRDPESWTFGEPLLYTVGLRYIGSQVVHASRVLPFVGEPLPDEYRDEVDGWGDSSLEASWDAISRYMTCARSLTIACERFIQSTFKVADLAEWVQGEGGATKALNRLQMLNMGLYTGNVAMIDGAVEEFERQGLPMTGLTDTLAELRKDVAGALRRPESHIFGQQQGTTRTGADRDAETYHTSIRSQAEEDGEPQLRQLVDIVAAMREGPINGRGLESYTLQPGALSEPDAATDAETLKLQSEAAKTLIEAGVIEPMEAREALTGEDRLIVPDDAATKRLQAEAEADPFDEEVAQAQVMGTTDAGRPAHYVMATGDDACKDCVFRRDAAGMPWCERHSAMVSDGYTCAAFERA